MSYSVLLDRTGTLHLIGTPTVDAARNVHRGVTDVATLYRLEQLSAREADLAQTTGASWRLFLPAGSPVKASSTFTDADTNDYEVVGTPSRVWARGYEHHVEVLLASAAGVDQ